MATRTDSREGRVEVMEGSRPKRAWRAVSPRDRLRERFFPNVVLSTHEGRSVRFYDDCVRGKTVTINFMFATCTGICPEATQNLVEVQRRLGPRLGRLVFMYSITLKPLEDTVPVLRKHARDHGVRPGWTFLTGKPHDITDLRRRLGVVSHSFVDDPDPMQHTMIVRYGNEPLMLWSAAQNGGHPDVLTRAILELAAPKR